MNSAATPSQVLSAVRLAGIVSVVLALTAAVCVAYIGLALYQPALGAAGSIGWFLPLWLALVVLVNRTALIAQRLYISKRPLPWPVTLSARWAVTILAPFLLMGMFYGMWEHRETELIDAAFVPIRTYIASHDQPPPDLAPALADMTTPLTFSYIRGDGWYRLSTAGGSVDIDGSPLTWDSRRGAWTRRHNDLPDAEADRVTSDPLEITSYRWIRHDNRWEVGTPRTVEPPIPFSARIELLDAAFMPIRDDIAAHDRPPPDLRPALSQMATPVSFKHARGDTWYVLITTGGGSVDIEGLPHGWDSRNPAWRCHHGGLADPEDESSGALEIT